MATPTRNYLDGGRTTTTANTTSDDQTTWAEGDLFTWHGAELLLIPVMLAIGIVGNLLVFYIYHFRWRSNSVTLFKRMLAVLDLVSLALAYPALLYLTVNSQSGAFTETCVFMSFVALATAVASGCVLVIIAVDRFMKLCLLRKTGVGHQFSKKLFAASILLSVVVNIPCGWIFGISQIFYRDYRVQISYCFIRNQSKSKPVFWAFAALLGVVFLAVSAALILLYYRIVSTLRTLSQKHEDLKRRPSFASTTDTLKTQKHTQVMRNSAVVFITITIVFFASYTPYFITLVLSMSASSLEASMSPVTKALYDLAKLCPLVNNVANPFIYSFSSDHFREEVKKMLTFKSCKKGFFRRRALSLSSRSQELSHMSDSRDEEHQDELSHMSDSRDEKHQAELSHMSDSRDEKHQVELSHMSDSRDEKHQVELSHMFDSVNEEHQDELSPVSESRDEKHQDKISHASNSSDEDSQDELSHVFDSRDEEHQDDVSHGSGCTDEERQGYVSHESDFRDEKDQDKYPMSLNQGIKNTAIISPSCLITAMRNTIMNALPPLVCDSRDQKSQEKPAYLCNSIDEQNQFELSNVQQLQERGTQN